MEIAGAFVGVAIVILVYGGLLFWPYWLTVRGLLLLSRKLGLMHPCGLFGISCGLVFFCSMAMTPISMIMAFLPAVALILFALIAVSGSIGWIVIGVKRIRNRVKVRTHVQTHPLHKLQFGVADLLIAVFYFAVWMAMGTLLLNVTLGEDANYGVGVLAVYFFSCTALGFYVSLDLLRRYEQTPYGPWAHFGILLGCLFLSTFSMLVGMLIVWRAWQKALLLLDMKRQPRQPPAAPSAATVQPETATT